MKPLGPRVSFRALAGITVLVIGVVASGCSSTAPKALERASSRTVQPAGGVPNLGPLGIEDTSLGSGPEGTRPPVAANPRSWMYDTFWGNRKFRTVNGHDSGIAANQVELGQIAIPGSHDSTTYEVGDYAAPCNDLGGFVKKFGKGMTERWARTQHYDLYRQATLGIRSFDLRIYYDGHSIRTCHTLDAASLDAAIRGDGGLNRFVKEQPLEPVILNLSHYKAPDGQNGTQWTAGLENLIAYLKANVCDQAVRTTNRIGAAREPARLSLLTIAEEHKNYVVVADDENGLYEYLAAHGMKDCVFRTNATMTGGYAGDRDVHLRNGGGWASTNLWLALVRAYVHELSDPAVKAREATQQVLLDGLSQRTPAKLHETSYIWVVTPPDDDGDLATIIVKQKYGDNLLQMTEKGVVTWNSFLVKSGEVEVGLLEHGDDFIHRLDERARELGTNVNIVNMDAVGDTPLTSNGFIRPLLELNARMVW